MTVNYGLLLLIYSPILLLLLITLLKDKYIPEKEVFKKHNWSLILPIMIIGFYSSVWVIKSFWILIPILKKYELNPSIWEVGAFLYYLFVLTLAYVFLRYVYKVSIIEIFDLKFNHFPFILKLCGVLAIINVLSIYLLDANLLLKPPELMMKDIETMDTKHIVLFSLVTIVLAPIVEETVCRGLLYAPLYRKVGRPFAIILSSLIWTQGHFEALVPSFGIFIVGVFLAWLYDRSGSLIHPIVFHMFKNSWLIVYFVK